MYSPSTGIPRRVATGILHHALGMEKCPSPPGPYYTTTEYTECQAFSPVVRIAYPRPLTRRRVLPPPPILGSRVDTLASIRGGGEGRGEPTRTKGRTFWFSRYSIPVIPLRTTHLSIDFCYRRVIKHESCLPRCIVPYKPEV
jgi:hypothetical protein